MMILPCPFCGCEPFTGGMKGWRGLLIHCVTEGCVNPAVNSDERDVAIAAWNRRDDKQAWAEPTEEDRMNARSEIERLRKSVARCLAAHPSLQSVCSDGNSNVKLVADDLANAIVPVIP